MEEEDFEVHIPETISISLPQTNKQEFSTPQSSYRKDAPAELHNSPLKEIKKQNRKKETEFSELLSQIKGLKHLQMKKMNEVTLIQKKLEVVENNRLRKK